MSTLSVKYNKQQLNSHAKGLSEHSQDTAKAHFE